jgi:hypothetical protein
VRPGSPAASAAAASVAAPHDSLDAAGTSVMDDDLFRCADALGTPVNSSSTLQYSSSSTSLQHSTAQQPIRCRLSQHLDGLAPHPSPHDMLACTCLDMPEPHYVASGSCSSTHTYTPTHARHKHVGADFFAAGLPLLQWPKPCRGASRTCTSACSISGRQEQQQYWSLSWPCIPSAAAAARSALAPAASRSSSWRA